MSMSLHDVVKVELTPTNFGDGHNWSHLKITHRSSGKDKDGEHADLTAVFEIALHHRDLHSGIELVDQRSADDDTVL